MRNMILLAIVFSLVIIVQNSIAADIGKLYKEVSPELVDALSLTNKKQSAPDETYIKISTFGLREDKSDIQNKIDKILMSVSYILNVSDINDVKDKIKSLKRKIKDSEEKKSKLREKAVENNKNYNDDIKDEDDKIQKYQSEIDSVKIEFNAQLSKLGLKLDSKQLDVWLSSVIFDDIISMFVIFDNVKQLTVTLETLMRESKESLDYAKKYYGMYLILLETVDIMQKEFIMKVDSTYIPSVGRIANEAQIIIQEAESGISSGKGNPEILKRNVDSNQLTIKAAEVYQKHLDERNTAVKKQNDKLQQDIFTAENTYKTVSTNSELFDMLQTGLKEFDAITKLELPKFVTFENLQMRSEFEKLTDQLTIPK